MITLLRPLIMREHVALLDKEKLTDQIQCSMPPLRHVLWLIVFVLTLPASSMAYLASGYSTQETDVRSGSLYVTLGYPALGVVGVMYQLSKQFAVGIEANGVVLSGEAFIVPPNAPGVGVKTSYFFELTKYFPLNALNIEASYLYRNNEDWQGNHQGVAAELTVGYESIRGRGVGVLFAMGAARTAYTRHDPLTTFAAKLGLHVDF